MIPVETEKDGKGASRLNYLSYQPQCSVCLTQSFIMMAIRKERSKAWGSRLAIWGRTYCKNSFP